MTDEKCPLCDTELEEFELLGTLSCPDCNYMSGGNGLLIDRSRIVFEIAEILQELAGEIKNINTDDELEKFEEDIERIKSNLKRLKDLEKNPVFHKIDDEGDLTYPSPKPPHTNPRNPPNKPWKHWQEFDTYTKQGSGKTFDISTSSTSQKIDKIGDLIDEMNNDEED